MNDQPQHEMVLETAHPSGAEEWYCPTCGRRFMLNWPPEYKKVVLNVGDEFVSHSGGKGGLSMGSIEVGKPQEPVLPAEIIATLEKILKDFDDPLNTFDSDK